MAKKKRKPPRKRANNKPQVVKQLTRYEKLLDSWVTKSVQAAKRVETYRTKVIYYRRRLDAITEEELAAAERAAEEAGRELRTIDLDGR